MPYQSVSPRSAPTPTEEDLDRAMTRAFHQVVRLHRAFDVPLVVWSDEQVQYVDPWSVPLPTDRKRGSEGQAAGIVQTPPGDAPAKL